MSEELSILVTTTWADASTRGDKLYELSNHLGNVLATVSDKKLGTDDVGNDGRADFYVAQVKSATDYYDFGWEMPGRKFSSGSYRHGFNGKENDRAWGGQLVQDYGFRIYNPAIGKFLSVDPLFRDYPELTPYQFASNTPIQAIDLDGLEMVGYQKLLKEGYGDNNMVTKVLNENTVWISYLNSTFVNMGSGDNLGATVNGRFANVSLNIEGVKANPDDPFGVTRIEYRDENGNWKPLENKRNAQNAQVRVAVKINLNTAKGMDGLITINHEIILHAEEKAQWIQDYQNGSINMQQLRQRYADNIAAGENNQGHRDMVLGTNQTYNAVNNATMVILDRLYKSPDRVEQYQYLDKYLSGLPPADTENKYVFKIPYSIQYQAKVNLDRSSTSQNIGGATRASFLQQGDNSNPGRAHEGKRKE